MALCRSASHSYVGAGLRTRPSPLRQAAVLWVRAPSRWPSLTKVLDSPPRELAFPNRVNAPGAGKLRVM